MEPQIPKPPQPAQKNSVPVEIKKEYLRTMQKDIAQMEEKKAETERSEILKKGFVAPQSGRIPYAPPSPQVRRPFPPPPLPPKTPIYTAPIKPLEPQLKPQEPRIEVPLAAPSPPPIAPRPIPPSIIKPMGLPPQQPPLPQPLRPFIPQRREPAGVVSATETTQEAISKFTLPPKKKKPPITKIMAGLILLFIIGGASGYWFFVKEGGVTQPPVSQPLPTPQPTPQAPLKETLTPPVSIIRVDKQIVHEINDAKEVKDIIAEGLKQPGPIHSLESMDFFLQNRRFLSFDEVAKALGVSIPNALAAALGDQYTLFRFWQKEGWRIGFAIQAKNITELKKQTALWEKTVVADSEDFFALLGKQSNRGPFKIANWQGVSFRYFDFLPKKLGVVYAIHPTQDIFVFTSSGDSMIDLINRIELK